MTDNHPKSELISELLRDLQLGDSDALNRLLPLVYVELRRIAEFHMQGERENHTLQPTALVNEAFLKLLGGSTVSFNDRAHFMSAASQAMRRILVDHARAHKAAKRGNNLCVTLEEDSAATPGNVVDMLVLDDAMNRLAAAEPRWARVVELRYFGGLEVDEVAATLGISNATVKRDWQFARAWLARELEDASLA